VKEGLNVGNVELVMVEDIRRPFSSLYINTHANANHAQTPPSIPPYK
jgi:hypothetical protein